MNHSHLSKAILFQGTLIALTTIGTPRLFAQADATTNYRTGISIGFSGTAGVDFVEEYYYHDQVISDRRTIYIKDSTEIRFSHNERNTIHYSDARCWIVGANGLDGIPNSGDEGTIRYKVDGDLSYGPFWSTANGSGDKVNPAYSEPLKFSTLRYTASSTAGVAVLGKTGNNGAPLYPRVNHYQFGQLDSVGDEWHAIQVADDDFGVISTGGRTKEREEWQASDGRYFVFVVNPKTPTIKVKASGNAQFYTTPAKNYYLPKIHEQTTYLDPRAGSISIELRNLDAKPLFYRINGGSWTKTTFAKIGDSAFNPGSNNLEFYTEGSPGVVKTRRVVKQPGFPSASENHGYLYFGSEGNFSKIASRITRAPYASQWTKGKADHFKTWEARRRQGLRFAYSQADGSSIGPTSSLIPAIYAKIEGASTIPATKNSSGASVALTYGQFAKETLLENCMVLDNVGYELDMNGLTLPNRELIYRGYWDVRSRTSFILAYDLMISFYKESGSNPDGITPIEDYYLRDCIGMIALQTMMLHNGMQGTDAAVKTLDTGGMWGSSLRVAGIYAALAMPSYSTPYYGTSGVDGNTQTYPMVPFIDSPLTWKTVSLDENAPLLGYPNLNSRVGLEDYNCRTSPKWSYTKTAEIGGTAPPAWFIDKKDYWSLLAPVFSETMYLVANHYPAKTFPQTLAVFEQAAVGNFYGEKSATGGYGPSKSIDLRLLNEKFPTYSKLVFTGTANDIRNLTTSDALSDDQLIVGGLYSALAAYDIDYMSTGVGAKAPEDVQISVSIK